MPSSTGRATASVYSTAHGSAWPPWPLSADTPPNTTSACARKPLAAQQSVMAATTPRTTRGKARTSALCRLVLQVFGERALVEPRDILRDRFVDELVELLREVLAQEAQEFRRRDKAQPIELLLD